MSKKDKAKNTPEPSTEETSAISDEAQVTTGDDTPSDGTPLPPETDPDTPVAPLASAKGADTVMPGSDTLADDATDTQPDTGDDATPGDATPDTAAEDAGDDTVMPAHSDSDADADAPKDATTEPEADPDNQSDTSGTTAEAASLPASDASAAVAPVPVVQEKIIERRGGFFPMVLGGVVAAGIGFVAAQVMGPGAWPFGTDTAAEEFRAATQARLDEQAETLGTLSGQVTDLTTAMDAIDLGTLQSGVDALGSRIDGTDGGLNDLGGALTTLDDRLTALEKRPVAESVSPEAIAAYERELEELRVAIETQREEMQTMAADAVAAEEAAETQAQLATARAALAQVTTALESGETFADPLAQLGATGEAPVPDTLSTVAGDGVATLAELAASFPPAARDALTEARLAGQDAPPEGGNRFSSFLRTQLGARSVTPRDGADPDAVLSRAEAAVLSGDLQVALDEISTLPDAAQAALSDWTSQARTRLDALAATDALMQELNKE